MDELSSDLASLKIDRAPRPNRPARRGVARILTALGVTVALGAAGVWGYQQYRGYVFQTVVETTEIRAVSPAQAALTLTSTGYVVPQTRSAVGTKVAGRVSRVHVAEGQKVDAGDVLIELEASDQQAALAAARSRVLTARADLATARAQLLEVQQQARRQRALVAGGAAARSTADDLDSRVVALKAQQGAAEASIRAARAEVGVYQAGVGQTKVLAPITGTVISDPVRAGESVDPAGKPLLELADLSTLMVETDIPEARLHLVKLGAPCEIVLDAFPGKRLRGEAAEVGQQVDRAKATVLVRVRFLDDTRAVLPEMSARVRFLAEALNEDDLARPDEHVIAKTAVARRGGGAHVFVVDKGMVRKVRVRLGGETSGGYALLDGPPPGTRLVDRPEPTLRDGQRIREASE